MRRSMLIGSLAILLAASVAMAAESFDSLFKEGYKAFRAKKNEAAKQAFQKAVAVAANPAQKAKGLLYAGYVEERLKEDKAAIETFGKILALKDAGPDMKSAALLYTGRCLSRLKKYDEAIKAYGEVAAMEKGRTRDRWDAMYGAAQLLAERKQDLKAAEGELQKLLAMPKLPKYWKARALYELGKVYMGQKQYAQARGTFEKAQEQGNVVYISWSLYRIGECWGLEKQPDKARATYERVIKMEKASKRAVKYAKDKLKALDKASAK